MQTKMIISVISWFRLCRSHRFVFCARLGTDMKPFPERVGSLIWKRRSVIVHVKTGNNENDSNRSMFECERFPQCDLRGKHYYQSDFRRLAALEALQCLVQSAPTFPFITSF